MLAGGGHPVVGGSALEQLDVGDEAGTREDALEEVVTQQRVLRHPPRQGRFECVDVVDSLAGIGPFPEEVLIDVGDGRRVRVDAGRTRRQALEERALAAGQGRGHARLEHGVALDDAIRARIEPRMIEGMRHRANQALDGAPRQPCVGVERDDVADSRKAAPAVGRKVVSSRSAEQAVQLVELPALALPPHPRALALAPEAPAVEQEEPLAAVLGRTVASIQTRHALTRRRQRVLVTRHGLGRRVRPIGEQGEAKIAIGVREVVHLEPLDLLGDVGTIGQEGRHDHHGPKVRRHAIAELEAGQRDRREQCRDGAIQERDRQVRSGNEGQEPEHDQDHRSRACRTGHEKRHRQDEAGDDDDRSEVSGRRRRDVGAKQPPRCRRSEADRSLEGQTPAADQIEAGVVLPVVGFTLRAVGAFCVDHRC